MKLLLVLLLAIMTVLLPYCKKDKTNSIQPKVQYAVFSDFTNGRKFAGLKILLLGCHNTGGPGDGCFTRYVIDSMVTDLEGKIKYLDDRVVGFACNTPGFFPFYSFDGAKIESDGLTYNIRLFPEAYLSIQLAPVSTYPPDYKFSLEWYCQDSLKYAITSNISKTSDIMSAVDSVLLWRIGGDLNNELRWWLSDGNFGIIARDTIRNIVVARSDTAGLRIEF